MTALTWWIILVVGVCALITFFEIRKDMRDAAHRRDARKHFRDWP